MLGFVIRRLIQAVFTIFGVMLLTFVLFRQVAGDIAAAHVGEKATEEGKAAWRHSHGYDKPMWLHCHNRLQLTDQTEGDDFFKVRDTHAPAYVEADLQAPVDALALIAEGHSVRLGRHVLGLDRNTSIAELCASPGKDKAGQKSRSAQAKTRKPAKPIKAEMKITVAAGSTFTVDMANIETCGELIDRINKAPGNKDAKSGKPLVRADIREWTYGGMFRSQFFDHLYKSVTFQAVSLTNNKKLIDIIVERAPYSLALMIPVTAIGWFLGMFIASFVAYYRGSPVDEAGVFLSVLGMCIPMLAFLIYGQLLMFHFEVTKEHAHGLAYRANIYVPIAILVIGGLGGRVRFYRTIILDETNRDYVRTARAKGVSVPGVLFKHVLKNCMLPILTSLVANIPFLILGSLLAESIFGIPGLGDLIVTSFSGRDEPVLNGIVFLTAAVYTLGLLLTDISYAVFDPRVRLK